MKFKKNWNSIGCTGLTFDYAAIPWDEEIFQRPIYEICSLKVEQANTREAIAFLLEFLSRKNIFLCTARVPTDDVNALLFLEDIGFRKIQTGYDLELNPRDFKNESNIVPLDARITSDRDREILISMIPGLFAFDRFYLDSRLDPKCADERYSRWILNSLDEPNDVVLLCFNADVPVGFFIVRNESPTTSRIILNGISRPFQGQGLGKRLWLTMLQHVEKPKLIVQVSSNNFKTLNLWFQHKAQIKVGEEILHYVS